ncbi:hypothetical protein [Amycolatopsis sp. La24]|uniref:hypothetical protein n=1 Tax=Amycolatopsis sp. La24 TaxID=3028304 RepID=UPI0023AEAD30|nr:hypothetical protein [Amycolatopsis sp. La24]
MRRIADPDAFPDLIEDAIEWNEQRRPFEHDTLAASRLRITLHEPHKACSKTSSTGDSAAANCCSKTNPGI